MVASSGLQNKINDAWTSLPTEVKVLDGSGKIDFEQSLNKANDLTQRNIVINKYLLDTWGMGNKFPNFDDTYGIVTRMFEELGLSNYENPFIQFINPRSSTLNPILTKQNLVNLNNWYSDGLIDYNDVSGGSSERTNHPIFQQKFYALEDPTFSLESYNFLEEKSNLKKLNYGALSSLPSSDILSKIANEVLSGGGDEASINSYVESNYDKIRRAFINNSETNISTFRKIKDLKKVLTLASRETSGGGGSRGVDKIGSDVRRMLGGLTDDERLTILKDLVGAYGIDTDDLKI